MGTALVIALIVLFISGVLAFTGIIKAAVTVARFFFYAALIGVVGLAIAIFLI